MPPAPKKSGAKKQKGSGGDSKQREADQRRKINDDAAARIQSAFRKKVARQTYLELVREKQEQGPDPTAIRMSRDLEWRQHRESIRRQGYPFVHVDLSTSQPFVRRNESHPAAMVARLSKLEVFRSGSPRLLDELGWPADKEMVGEVLAAAEAQRVRKTFRTRSKTSTAKTQAKSARKASSGGGYSTFEKAVPQVGRVSAESTSSGETSNATSSGSTSFRSSADPAPAPDAPLDLKGAAQQAVFDLEAQLAQVEPLELSA